MYDLLGWQMVQVWSVGGLGGEEEKICELGGRICGDWLLIILGDMLKCGDVKSSELVELT